MDMLKAAEEPEVRRVTDICNEVVSSGVVPEDWKRSWMVNVYKVREMLLNAAHIDE